MSECNKTYLLTRKCIHPKVLKVLEKFAPVSPLLVPKDQHQPKEGILCISHSECLQNQLRVKQEIIIKAPTTLNLESALFKRRRLSQTFN